MADIPQNEFDQRTRANLAYIWSAIAGLILAYIVLKWGDQKEILTLIIGLIGGTVLGGIFGIYFGGSIATKKPDQPTITQTGDSPQTIVNPPISDTETKI